MIMRPDGSDRRLVTKRSRPFSPDWSPDGARLLYSGSHNGTRNLYSIAVDGAERVNVTPTPNAFEWLGIYSPNGKKIVYDRTRRKFDADEVWIMSVDGSNPHPITRTPHIAEFSPSWRPT